MTSTEDVYVTLPPEMHIKLLERQLANANKVIEVTLRGLMAISSGMTSSENCRQYASDTLLAVEKMRGEK